MAFFQRSNQYSKDKDWCIPGDDDEVVIISILQRRKSRVKSLSKLSKLRSFILLSVQPRLELPMDDTKPCAFPPFLRGASLSSTGYRGQGERGTEHVGISIFGISQSGLDFDFGGHCIYMC